MKAALANCREWADHDGRLKNFHLEHIALVTLLALKRRGFITYKLHFEGVPTGRTYMGMPVTLSDISAIMKR